MADPPPDLENGLTWRFPASGKPKPPLAPVNQTRRVLICVWSGSPALTHITTSGELEV